MPVKIFVGRDIQKFTHFPDKSHEARGVRHICEYLWDVWHHQSSRHYAIVANPKQTKTGRELSADLVIISELGIGVVDLKEYYGEIRCSQPGKPWKAGPIFIKAGSEVKNYANPHEQVQDYASDIREDLIATHSFTSDLWEGWEEFKVHTAVCFTHPDAKLETCQRAIQRMEWQDTFEVWEKFDILSAKDVRDWGADLRFDVDMGPVHGFRQYSLEPEQVYNLATDFFGARLWLGMQVAMPLGRPLAYLTVLEEGKQVQNFNISREVATIGRTPESHIVVPVEFETVSRNHAIITRTIDGFVLQDNKSKNGTYVKNHQLREGETYLLQEDDIIMLGGLKEDKTVCCLKFSRKAPPPLSTTFGSLDAVR